MFLGDVQRCRFWVTFVYFVHIMSPWLRGRVPQRAVKVRRRPKSLIQLTATWNASLDTQERCGQAVLPMQAQLWRAPRSHQLESFPLVPAHNRLKKGCAGRRSRRLWERGVLTEDSSCVQLRLLLARKPGLLAPSNLDDTVDDRDHDCQRRFRRKTRTCLDGRSSMLGPSNVFSEKSRLLIGVSHVGSR